MNNTEKTTAINNLEILKNTHIHLFNHYSKLATTNKDKRLDTEYWYHKGLAKACKDTIEIIERQIEDIKNSEDGKISYCPFCKHFAGCENYLYYASTHHQCSRFERLKDESI